MSDYLHEDFSIYYMFYKKTLVLTLLITYMTFCKCSRTVCLYCSLDGDKIAEFVGYLHVRRLLACSSATCISVGYSTYMCQFSFNIKAPLFVCSSLALNLLTTRLLLLPPVDLASFPNSFSRPFRLGPSLSNSRLSSFARFAPYIFKALFRHRRPCNRSIHRRIHFLWLLETQLHPGLKTPEMTTPTRQLHPIPIASFYSN